MACLVLKTVAQRLMRNGSGGCCRGLPTPNFPSSAAPLPFWRRNLSSTYPSDEEDVVFEEPTSEQKLQLSKRVLPKEIADAHFVGSTYGWQTFVNRRNCDIYMTNLSLFDNSNSNPNPVEIEILKLPPVETLDYVNAICRDTSPPFGIKKFMLLHMEEFEWTESPKPKPPKPKPETLSDCEKEVEKQAFSLLFPGSRKKKKNLKGAITIAQAGYTVLTANDYCKRGRQQEYLENLFGSESIKDQTWFVWYTPEEMSEIAVHQIFMSWSSPKDGRCDIMIVHGPNHALATCRLGDKFWTNLGPGRPAAERASPFQTLRIEEIEYSRGQFHCRYECGLDEWWNLQDRNPTVSYIDDHELDYVIRGYPAGGDYSEVNSYLMCDHFKRIKPLIILLLDYNLIT
ncbi:hypothetical protein COLO4_05800 [Corchorus olitorius]|uniref:KIB1-4 beta-propeller domain-containing protein n=1 Tax=Corchorus olitorius TaxID=93759 RepID=A0A1R3KPU5_9ROSI|nr:hypothetical protein COLO4_05800 [Corchorus olitorius]